MNASMTIVLIAVIDSRDSFQDGFAAQANGFV